MKKTAAVLTISDKGSKGERKDTSGPAICKMLEDAGYQVIYQNILPDEKEQIQAELIQCADVLHASLVLTTGGTGFSPRDITPEATLAVVEREARGIPEAMRAASMQITPRGCLSRSVAGIRGGTLIINLPGSEKAAKENLAAVLPAIGHGLEMLASAGSADCAAVPVKKEIPSMDRWLQEAKKDADASKVGMYLVHNGIVRETAREKVRNGAEDTKPVKRLLFSYDPEKVSQAVEETRKREGIYYVRVWLNEGELSVGEDIMYVMIGGDIRPRVLDALDFLVGKIKSECVKETELYAE
ncbi:MAG: molybdenum cofactor synthesis domain-containing protein [Anaerotignum sp.]